MSEQSWGFYESLAYAFLSLKVILESDSPEINQKIQESLIEWIEETPREGEHEAILKVAQDAIDEDLQWDGGRGFFNSFFQTGNQFRQLEIGQRKQVIWNMTNIAEFGTVSLEKKVDMFNAYIVACGLEKSDDSDSVKKNSMRDILKRQFELDDDEIFGTDNQD
jgi:hypothetical protein